MVKRNSFLIGLLVFSMQISAIAPLGLFVPYDLNIRGERPHQNGKVHLSFLAEKSHKISGFDFEGNKVNPLQIYDTTQNILGLYVGFTGNSEVKTAITGGEDSNHGMYTATGTYKATQFAFGATYAFGSGFLVRSFLPIYSVSLSDVSWAYSGNLTSFGGASLADVFSSFETESKELFGLNVSGWNTTSIGDFAIIFDWERDFPRRESVLRNVRPILRLGITLPTGLQKNTVDFGAMSFGADGSITIPFGGGVRVDLGRFVEFGFNSQICYIWGKTKLQRIKTSPYQSDFLMPIIANAAKQYGVIQNFSIYGGLYSKCRCFSLKGFYEYIRKGEDIITPVETKYSYNLINNQSEDGTTGRSKGQKSLDESTSHSFTIRAGYDNHYADSNNKFIPQVYLFSKTSFYGSYANIASTIGLQLLLDF